MATASTGRSVTLLDQKQAQEVDARLMSEEYGYTLEQLMEMAGVAVAVAATRECPERRTRVVAVCGPGNNGGDGLVAARHLTLFGYQQVALIYPKPGRLAHYRRLLTQARQCGVDEVRADDAAAVDGALDQADLLIDAIFGFSFQADAQTGIREPFASLIARMNRAAKRPTVLAVDVPSGWHVECGPHWPDGATAPPCVRADVLVSLTAPKRCAQHFIGRAHYLGGRFVPPPLARALSLCLPEYPGTECVVRLSPGDAVAGTADASNGGAGVA
ncbi:hypothetical protein CDCA_CDCA07G2267 [Cyanidium caldarium]|uniref:NAD(P)H-hydrate epimerase n=1 Tax=Cyanidium caldarium TaxID=2771 RepID=A0AAV9IVF6_CYACA|nr:hypothetical protein CDCA_CDCA07G2267 [Cyanidium caldarium]